MTEFLMMVLFMRALRDTDYGPSWKDITDGWRILIPGAASAVILMAPVNIIMRATLALAVYVAGILLTGALDHMDRAIIRSIIRG